MDKVTRTAKALRKRHQRQQVVYGVWQGAESEDANLSKVRIAGAELDGSDLILRYVPRAAHVTGLTTSSTVICLGNPLCIIAVVVGDVTLATA